MVEKYKSNNVIWQRGKVTYEDRCKILNQCGLVVWFTGLPAAGKSTIAVEVEKELVQRKKVVFVLDGDNIRHGLNADLGFSKEDRNENVRRVAEVAALFKDAGIIALVCLVSPYRDMREFAREKVGKESFIEIYVKADVATCIKRDPKGFYKKANKEEIKNFTGISDPYEEPENPNLVIDSSKVTVRESAKKVIQLIELHLI